MLDLNRALGSNVLSLNAQLETSSSLLNQATSEFSSVSFTDLLANLQAESEQFQSETGAGLAAQPFHYASSLPVYTPPERAATFSASTSSPQNKSDPTEPSKQALASGNTDPARGASSAGHSTPVIRGGGTSYSHSGNQSEPTNTEVSTNSNEGFVSQTSRAIQTGSQAAGEPAIDSVAAASQQTALPQTMPQLAAPQPTAASGQSGIPSGLVSKNSQTVAGTDAKNQKSASPAAVQSNDADLLTQAPVLGGKSAEKLKTHKDEIMQGQTNLVNGVAAAGNDPLVAAINPDPIANTASSLVPVDVGQNTAPLTTTRSGGKTGSSSDLAFAIKIQGNNPIVNVLNQSNAPVSASPDLSKDLSYLNAPITTTESSPQMIGTASLTGLKAAIKGFSDADQGSGSLTTLIRTAPMATSSFAESDKDVPATEENAPVAAVAEDQPVNTPPVKTVQVQITGADDQKVDLKLVEKSGSLTMSVRSTDGSLTKALQQNLPDLSTRLNDQQIKAEWWRPDAQQPDMQKNSGGSSRSADNSANQDQGGQSKGNSGQQGGRRNPQPEWVEDHNLSRKSNQNGTNFSWQL